MLCAVTTTAVAEIMATEARQSSSADHSSARAVTWKQLCTADGVQRKKTSSITAATGPGPSAGSKSAPLSPEVRSGHATTLLRSTESMLLFGGSDGKVFYNDFYVLEPEQYGALNDTQYSTSSSSNGEASRGEISSAERLDQSFSASSSEQAALPPSQRPPESSSQSMSGTGL